MARARVGGLAPPRSPASQARADEFADRLHEMRQIGAQPIEARQPVQGALIHVERPIDLDLETVAGFGAGPPAPGALGAPLGPAVPLAATQPRRDSGGTIGILPRPHGVQSRA